MEAVAGLASTQGVAGLPVAGLRVLLSAAAVEVSPLTGRLLPSLVLLTAATPTEEVIWALSSSSKSNIPSISSQALPRLLGCCILLPPRPKAVEAVAASPLCVVDEDGTGVSWLPTEVPAEAAAFASAAPSPALPQGVSIAVGGTGVSRDGCGVSSAASGTLAS